jgi:hypothetical protein
MKSKYLDANYLKFRTRLFTYEEMIKHIETVVDEMKDETALNMQYIISLLTTVILNAKPFGFGKKRLTEYFQLFFDQLNYLGTEPEDYDLVNKTVRDLGLKFERRKKKLKLHIEE